MSYTDAFGGSVLQPSDVAYRAVALGANLALVWPQNATSEATVAARIMDVTPSGVNRLLALPDAREVSVGQDVLIRNLGANLFTVTDVGGNTLMTVAPGEVKYAYLTDNTSANGVWRVLVFGVGVGALDAAAIAGAGLQASGVQLQVNLLSSTVSAAFAISAADRARNYIWTGGVAAISLPSAVTLGSGFFWSVRNQGTGVLTIAAFGGEMVDGAVSITLQPQESAMMFTTGSGNWYSVGRGRNQQFNFTLLVKNITGGTVVLTSIEAANVVQRYTGALVSNASIVLPSVVQVYYVSNQTSGAFTVTFRTAGVGTTVSVPAGQNAVLFCDGTNVINNSTTVSGLTSLLLSPGSVTAPSIAYSGDSSTGIYQPVGGSVSVAGSGTEVARFTGVGSGVNYLSVSNAIAAAAPTLTAAGPDANININIVPKGTGTLQVNGVGVLFGNSVIIAASGTVGAPGYTFFGDLDNGWWRPAADTQAWSVGGVEVMRLVAAGPTLTNARYGAVRDAESFSSRLTSTAGYTGLRLAEPGDGRRFELFYLGSASAGFYGASANDVVQNVQAAAGRFIWSMGDTARMRLEQTGQLLLGTTTVGIGASANTILSLGNGSPNVFASIRASGGQEGLWLADTNGVVFGSFSNHQVSFRSNNLNRAYIPITGGIQVEAPSGGGIWLQALNSAVNGSRAFNGANLDIAYGNYFASNRTELACFGALSIGTTTAQDIIVLTNNVTRFQVTAAGLLLDGANLELGFKGIPRVTAYTGPVSALRGKMIAISAGVTISATDGWAAGDAFSFYNDSGSAITLTQGAATTLRLAGTGSTGSRTLAARGMCTVWANSSSEFIMSGAGLT